jgi:hypothetical protein
MLIVYLLMLQLVLLQLVLLQLVLLQLVLLQLVLQLVKLSSSSRESMREQPVVFLLCSVRLGYPVSRDFVLEFVTTAVP